MTVFLIEIMTNIHSSSTSILEDGLNSASSLYSNTNNYIEQQPARINNTWHGLMFLLVTASISSDIDINHSYISSSLSSVHPCSIYGLSDRENIDVLRDFISNLINNSEDLDGRIVDMVNEKFWDLI
ncbi:MAG: hypothetical protein LBB84_05035 [Tannerellaceae bacterium]|jgi:hypothetical protein|nr:hypothetical protein [Tannerellaceae bacterium]